MLIIRVRIAGPRTDLVPTAPPVGLDERWDNLDQPAEFRDDLVCLRAPRAGPDQFARYGEQTRPSSGSRRSSSGLREPSGASRTPPFEVRLRAASSSLSGLSAKVESMERTSENLAYAALTVPRTTNWSWRSFS
jgi:hypothetical protein